ncbi:MAG: glycoside hydrolase family 3 protein [Chloroflexota bacterium]|nr:glycoside hydrolase family 3 protein [Chloroflexota bacterium]MDE2894133.1 glycoside hydrolase family 3 protein [Chloroflexota bacterium]
MARRAVRPLLLALAGILTITATLAACSSDDADSLSLEDAVGQMLLIGFRGEILDDEVEALLKEIAPGAVILFDYDGPSGGEQVRNVVSPEQLQALTASLQETSELPLLIAIDAEGGFVNRLKEQYGFEVQLPSHLTLGAGTPSQTASLAGASAQQLSDLGINWNLAPVVDVNVFPESPAIGYWERSFSDDPALVAEHAAAFARAHHEQGVVSTLKHFPGHGSAVGDTHLGVTDVTDSFIREAELAPYRTLIEDGYDDVVMTAHVVNRHLDPSARPATLSRPIVTDLLRGELGFGGVILSDDMQMGAILEEYSLETAAIEAIKAGVDVILIANQNTYDIDHVRRIKAAIIAAVEQGEISRQRIDESVARILALKRKYGLID